MQTLKNVHSYMECNDVHLIKYCTSWRTCALLNPNPFCYYILPLHYILESNNVPFTYDSFVAVKFSN